MSDSDVFREVDEDYRHERMIAFWRRHGVTVLALVLAVLAAVAGANYLYMQAQARKAAQTTDLELLLANLKPGAEIASADELAAYAAKASPAQATLALFAEASLRQRAGDNAGTARVYHQIADGSAAKADLRDLAIVRLGYFSADQQNPEPMIPRLETIARGNGPWRFSAREAIGLLTARSGQRESAAKMFSDLAGDPGTPPDMAGRARALAELYRGK
jgi:hypothetical protein